MPIVQEERFIGTDIRKRLGRHREYGRSHFGFSVFGEIDDYMTRDGYGNAIFGKSIYADIIVFSGIYRHEGRGARKKIYREPYYIGKNPRTDPQQLNRGKFANAISDWQGLTNAQKRVYDIAAVGKHMSGYNFFIKQSMES